MRGERDEPRLLFSEKAIDERVGALAESISRDYADAGEVHLVGVLKGAFIFLADLSRRLTVPNRVDFVSVASYGSSSSSSGDVRLLLDLRTSVRDRHVLLVDDIYDSGSTLGYLSHLLSARRPASLRTCVLLHKRREKRCPIDVDYVGFEIPNVWVVGYGLDFADRHRTLPFIGVMRPPDAAARR